MYDVNTQNFALYKYGMYRRPFRVKFTTYVAPLVQGFFVRESTPLILSELSLISLRHMLNKKRNPYNP